MIISICNQKGGVGKTTTAINLGAALALNNQKTLIVDFDPQANATSGLGIKPDDSLYLALTEEKRIGNFINKTKIDNLDIIPSSPSLAGALVDLVYFPDREYRLRKVLTSFSSLYDFILIDLPPSLSLLTINGLVSSETVLIPIGCGYYSLEGISQLLSTIDLVKKNLGFNLWILGAVLTMYNNKERFSREIRKNVRRYFPYDVFETEIPKSVLLAEAPSFSKSIFEYNKESKGAYAYLSLAKEIIIKAKPLLLTDSANYSENIFNLPRFN